MYCFNVFGPKTKIETRLVVTQQKNVGQVRRNKWRRKRKKEKHKLILISTQEELGDSKKA